MAGTDPPNPHGHLKIALRALVHRSQLLHHDLGPQVHYLHHSWTSAAKSGHTNLALTRREVNLVPAWAKPSKCVKTAMRYSAGIQGLSTPVAPLNQMFIPAIATSCTQRELSTPWASTTARLDGSGSVSFDTDPEFRIQPIFYKDPGK